MATNYPDITPLLAAKQQRRRELAALSWEEKVAIVEKMRRLLPRHQWRRPGAPAADTANPDSVLAHCQAGLSAEVEHGSKE
jgi:hypothetical protein